MKRQALMAALAAVIALPVFAQTGFYGGVSLRENGRESVGLALGDVPLAWSRFSLPGTDDGAQRALLFGGYRWRNDVSIEAALNTSDRYGLRPLPAGPGLRLGGGQGEVSRAWNADVYTSWEFIRTQSLYGRLGYAQSDQRLSLASAPLLSTDIRHPRDGVNYGLGLRYDVTHSLGLRVEYARFGRFAGDSVNGLPESDQVSIGIQFKF